MVSEELNDRFLFKRLHLPFCISWVTVKLTLYSELTSGLYSIALDLCELIGLFLSAFIYSALLDGNMQT